MKLHFFLELKELVFTIAKWVKGRTDEGKIFAAIRDDY
jgi:hypothetical protein